MAKKEKKVKKLDKSKVKNINPNCIDCPYDCYQFNYGTIEYCKRTKEGYKMKKFVRKESD
jgi:hypothetical protein